MRRIIAGLDIGDAWIKLVVGEIVKDKLCILACCEVPSRGIKKGFVVNPESTVEALNEVFNKAEETLGIRPNKVVVNIPCNDAESFMTESFVSVEGEDKIITNKDITNVLKSSTHKKYDDSYELVTVIPTKYRLDDTTTVKQPVGMKADKIEVKAVAVIVPKKNIAAIAKCLELINVKIVDICLGPIADYYCFEEKEYKNIVGAVVNIGDVKTEVSIFNKGVLTNCEVIDIGGEKIDYDLSYVYKINRRDAVYLKEELCIADKKMAVVTEAMNFVDKNRDQIKINQYDATEIVEARLDEILNLIKKQINLLTKKEISYIIITGGVTETGEFKHFASKKFKNLRIGEVTEIGARNNKYSTAIGLIRYYDNKLNLRNKNFSIFTVAEQEEFGGINKKVNLSENSILGKLFGYFFDN